MLGYISKPNLTAAPFSYVPAAIGAGGALQIAAKYVLQSILIVPTGAANVSAGTAPGAADLWPEVPVSVAGGILFINLPPSNAEQTIYINNLPAGSLVYILGTSY